MIVTNNESIAEWCKVYRNYGKRITGNRLEFDKTIGGMNFRISEFTAALGCIQMRNLSNILEYKRRIANKYDMLFENRVVLPEGMQSGYYKYIVFNQEIKWKAGKVFELESQACYIDDEWRSLENCIWIGNNHTCIPIYSNKEYSDLDIDEMKALIFI